MEIGVFENKHEASRRAAEWALRILSRVIASRGKASFAMATGASQFDFIEHLTRDRTVDWPRTCMFHLDEYTGLDENHPASFRRYLRERFVERVAGPGEVHLVRGDAPDPEAECARLNEIITQNPIDVAFVGIGENGHLAFNDPPADFETDDPFIVVKLDEDCRNQQLGEGWFASREEVPRKAISMSIKQILRSRYIICTVPERRKAEAVRDCFKGEEIDPAHPASVLKKHDRCYVYLDRDSASLLDG